MVMQRTEQKQLLQQIDLLQSDYRGTVVIMQEQSKLLEKYRGQEVRAEREVQE